MGTILEITATGAAGWLPVLAESAAKGLILLGLSGAAACDDLTIRAGCPPTRYARHLVEIAAGLRPGRMTGSVAIAMAQTSRLESRLRAILDPRRNRRTITRLLAAVLVSGLMAVIVPLPILRAAVSDEPAVHAAQQKIAEKLVAQLQERQFGAAVESFSPTLAEALSTKELERIWNEFRRRCGSFEGALGCDRVRIDDADLVEIRGRWKEAVMLIRLTFDDQNRIDGFWLARDREGPTPKKFLQGGYAFGDSVERLRAGLTLNVELLPLDETRESSAPPVPPLALRGQALGSWSIRLMRAVEGPVNEGEEIWHDPATGKTWQYARGYETAGPGHFEQLEPGLYRAVAWKGHSNAVPPMGVSAPARVAQGQEPPTLVVSVLDGPTLTFRAVDAVTGSAAPRPSISLTRADDRLPPWTFHPPWSREEGAVPTLERVPPGTYRVAASLRASHPDDLERELAGEPLEIEVARGQDREIVLPMRGEPLTQAEIEKRWPWSAFGAVTEAEGKPMAGVEIWVHAGMGTLFRTGKAVTDSNGRYEVRFGPGIHVFASKQDPEPTNLQAAIIAAHRRGFVEKNLNRQGRLTMANRTPSPEGYGGKMAPEQILLPHQPRKLDFVMVPEAVLRVTLLDEQGQPEPEQPLSLAGKEMPPGSSVIGGQKTDAEGRAVFERVAPGYGWSFAAEVKNSRERFESQPIVLQESGQYSVTLREARDAKTGIRWLEIVRVTDREGRDVREQVLAEDPFARPPVAEELQAKGRGILRKMAEANRHWLLGPPKEVKSYAYQFHLGDKLTQSFRVADPGDVHPWIRQGISFTSAVHYLAEHPDEAAFRLVEVGPERITLVYHLARPASTARGMGLYQTWHGFSSDRAGEGRLVLDATKLTPLEHTSGDLVERPSDYVQLAPGRYAPLRIAIEGSMQFDWRFRVYNPGLWLFDKGFHRDGKDKAEPAAYTDQVQVNGQEARVEFPADEQANAAKSTDPGATVAESKIKPNETTGN